MEQEEKNLQTNKEKFRERTYELNKIFYIRGIHHKIETKAMSVANKRIPVYLRVGGGSYTDGRQIVVGLFEEMVFEPIEEIIATLIALAGHEGQHVRSSSFTEYKKFIERTGALYKTTKNSVNFWKYVAKSIGNIIEDGRIENILVNRRKGFLPYIKRLRLKLWNDSLIKPEFAEMNELNNYFNAILSYATLGIYPKGFVDTYNNTRLKEEVDKVLPLIDEGVQAIDAVTCLNVCGKIIEANHDYLEELYAKEMELYDLLKNALEKAIREGADFQSDPDPKNEEFNNDNTITIRIRINQESDSDEEPDEKSGKQKQDDKDKDDSDNKEGKCDEVDDTSENGGESENDEKNEENNSDESPDIGECPSLNNNKDSDAENGKSSSDSISDSDDKDGDSGKDLENGSKNDSESDNSEEKASEDSDSNKYQDLSSDSIKENNNANMQKSQVSIEDLINKELKGFDNLLEEVKGFVDKEVAQENKRIQEIKAMENKADLSKEMLGKEEIKADVLNTKEDPIFYEIDEVSKIKDMEILGEPLRDAEKLRIKYESLLEQKSTYTRNNLKRGKIKSRDLIKLAQKDTKIFSRKGEPYIPDAAITILIDWSGSMYGENAAYATMSAAKLEHALRKIIPLRIAAFNAHGIVTQYYSIKKFDEMSAIRNKSIMFYSQFHPNFGNRDGDAIRIAAKELEKRYEENKLLIILSDGLPSSYNSEEDPILDVRTAINDARKKGIEVIGIFFGTEHERKACKESYEKMYCYNIINTDPENIQVMLINIIENII